MRDRNQDPYLVTSRRAVVGSGEDAPATVLRVLMHAHGRPFGVWIPVTLRLGDEHGRPLWYEHPVHGVEVDVIALPIPQNVEEAVDLISYQVAESPLSRVDIASELFVIGFPIGFSSLRANAALGVWCRGTVAWPPSLDWEGLPRMLLDFRARPGQIGSPVVAYMDDTRAFIMSDGRPAEGRWWDLVGMYGGGTTSGDVNVGVVWKRSVIDDIVERGLLPDGPCVPHLDEAVDWLSLAEPPRS
ncbi:hypothetical protein [Kitasatospora sp. MBT66]|uniref:hypothetical protein n=1 Tax=Kitasatospora sp. MBT66 TaxID=1444769 RepID=UPI0005B8C846|nr:hypothetical protein [Kitasatospora sp. MBT66]